MAETISTLSLVTLLDLVRWTPCLYRGIRRRTLLPAGIKGGYSYYELKPSGANYGYCVYAVYRGSITTAYRISEINRTVCIWPQPILPREGHVRSAVVVSGDLGTLARAFSRHGR